MSIKETLKEIRLEQGVSQQSLGDMIGASQNTISNYESGRRGINDEVLEIISDALGHKVSFIKKDIKAFTLEVMTHTELVEKMNYEILKKTGINMDFYFELCSDGNLDLFVRHKFSKGDMEKLIELGWIDSGLEELEDYSFEECGYIYNPFIYTDELELPNQLFWFILEETFGEGADVVGVYDLNEYVQLNISIPV